jgi:hypothetical protein
VITSCGQSAEDKLAHYQKQIGDYDCESLDREYRFNTQMIEKLSKADEEYSPEGDIALTALTLGTDLIRDGNNVSTSHNYQNRITLLNQKQAFIEQKKQEKCNHARS